MMRLLKESAICSGEGLRFTMSVAVAIFQSLGVFHRGLAFSSDTTCWIVQSAKIRTAQRDIFLVKRKYFPFPAVRCHDVFDCVSAANKADIVDVVWSNGYARQHRGQHTEPGAPGTEVLVSILFYVPVKLF